LGHVFNGYDTKHLKTNLKGAPVPPRSLEGVAVPAE
jgi:hypothetical protein